MYNLIQIQDAIKGLPIQDVMKYARGSNPEVPAYLALTELNRRKQLQDTAVSFYGEPQTVREQIESSLTGAPQGQVNPTAAPQMANPTIPPQLQTLTAPPPKPEMPQMPPQMNPTQAPPMPQMRRGGLASLPVGMFKRVNYAGGGIVAFEGGGTTGEFETQPSQQALALDELRRREAEKRSYDYMLGYKKPEADIVPEEKPEIKDVKSETQNKQASATSSGQITKREPASPTFGQQVTITQPKISELSPEELFERRRKLQELAGVSQDPYADIKKRYADIEAKRAKQEADDPKNALRAMLRGFAQAEPSGGLANILVGGSEKMAAFDKETAALRDKQATTMADLQLNMAKEEDARRRGDVTALEASITAQKKDKMDLAKLDIDIMNAQSNRMSATRPAGEVQIIERYMKDKNMTFADAMEAIQSGKSIQKIRADAIEAWNKNRIANEIRYENKGGFAGYMAELGLSVPGGGAPKVMSMADVKETAKKSGRTEKEVIDAAKSKGYTIQ